MVNAGDVAAVVTDRCGAFLTAVTAATGDAETPNIDQAIAWALRALGYPTANMLAPSTSEVQAVADAKGDALLDLAELRMLESIQTNLTAVTVKAGPVQEDFNDLSARLATIINEKRANVTERYGRWIAVQLAANTRRRATLRAV